MPSPRPPENRSTLALLQAAAVFSAIAGMAIAFWIWHANTPWLAWSVVVLVLSGEPIDEPIVGYGPFVMNSEAEIAESFDDFHAGRFGQMPAETARR